MLVHILKFNRNKFDNAFQFNNTSIAYIFQSGRSIEFLNHSTSSNSILKKMMQSETWRENSKQTKYTNVKWKSIFQLYENGTHRWMWNVSRVKYFNIELFWSEAILNQNFNLFGHSPFKPIQKIIFFFISEYLNFTHCLILKNHKKRKTYIAGPQLEFFRRNAFKWKIDSSDFEAAANCICLI